MFKRVAALMFGLVLVFAVMLPVFANDSDKAFELVEPSFGKNNEVFVERNMLINIRIYEEIPLEMSLVRIEPNIADALRDEISSLEDNSAHIMPVLGSEEMADIDLSDVTVDFEVQTSYEEDERRDIAEAYLETLIEKQGAEEEFIRAYDRYKDLFALGESEENGSGVDLANMTYYQQEIVKEYKRALEQMMISSKRYELIKPVYESIFETVVIGPEEVTLGGVVPFYRTAIEDVRPGDYKLIFTSEDDVIEVRAFTVKKLEEDKIKKSTTDILSNVINENSY